MDYLENKVDFLKCHSVLPPTEKDTHTTFALLTYEADSTEDFHFFDDIFFSFKVPYIT